MKAIAVLQTLKQAIELSHFNNSGVTFGKDTIAEINEAIAELEPLNAPKTSTKKIKDAVKCDYKAARSEDGNCSALCTMSGQFYWNSERKMCQIKDEYRHLLKEAL